MTDQLIKPKLPIAPISWGELIDKLTILEIKSGRLTNDLALTNVNVEKLYLEALLVTSLLDHKVLAFKIALFDVNQKLWDIEDRIRDKERLKEFDDEFILLARSVYKENDARAAIKRKINIYLKSELIEEKSYKKY
jgi:hypothetical protein